MRSLRELQRAFFKGMTDAAAGGDASAALIGEIQGDGRLDADARLGVYARMYVARLIDVLLEDYPRVAAVLGGETFATMARRYVAAQPSTHPSLRWFGGQFATLLERASAAREVPAFVPDLARLEWARLEVFDAAEAAPLDLATLRRLPPERWPALRFALVPAVVLLQSAWPVHRIWDGPAATDWMPEPTWLRVWRRDAQVFQAAMDHAERVALAHVQAGDDFAALCTGVASVVSPEAAAETASGLLMRWVEDGVLAVR